MHSLTKNQEAVLRFIHKFTRQNGMSPSFSEIGKALGGIKSSTVFYYVRVLIKKGFLRQAYSKARSLRLASATSAVGLTGFGTRGVPILGRVPAGKPNLVFEEPEDTIWLDERFCKDKDCYLLRVTGDSMIGVGICNEDLVIVRPQNAANAGDTVVARTFNGEGTVKTLKKKGSTYFLQPENPKYSSIREKFDVVGKVIGVLRDM